MNVIVNKKDISIPPKFTMGMLLKQLKFTKSVAIFVNGRQLLMAEYDGYELSQSDDIKIIKPLGGG